MNIAQVIMIAITLLISLRGQTIQKYQTVHLKDKFKVDSFAFSNNQQHMVIYQGSFYYQQTPSSSLQLRSLPHFIFQQTKGGYQLISKQFTTNITSADLGKIYINRQGTIFISSAKNNEIRVYSMENRRTRLVQVLSSSSDRIFNAELTFTNNLIIATYASNNGFTVYKGGKDNFTFYYSNNTNHLKIKISPDGKLVVAYTSVSSMTIYINSGVGYQPTLNQIEQLDLQPTYIEFFIGKQEEKQIYTIMMVYRGNQGYQSQASSLKLRSYEFDLTSRKLTLKQKWSIIDKEEYIFYLTKNSQYFAYASTASQQMVIYGKSNGQYDYFDKFWNFTQGPSDIYVSEDKKFIAVANKFKYSNFFGQKYSNISEQIAFRFRCDVSNCESCAWINKCSKCGQQYMLNNGKCIKGYESEIKDNYFYEPLTSEKPLGKAAQEKQQSNKAPKNYKEKLETFTLWVLLMLVLALGLVWLLVSLAASFKNKSNKESNDKIAESTSQVTVNHQYKAQS